MAERNHTVWYGTLVALLGCASDPPPEPEVVNLPPTLAESRRKGLGDWLEYVCSIPDAQARQEAIDASREQNGWIVTCAD